MIEAYKITGNIYDDRVTTNILTMKEKNKYMGLRGHEFTLEQKRICKLVCKNFFSNRIVILWNKLPENVVRSESLNNFKNRLDSLMLWHNNFKLNCIIFFSQLIISPAVHLCYIIILQVYPLLHVLFV